jgi:hypothetical protein
VPSTGETAIGRGEGVALSVGVCNSGRKLVQDARL